MMECACTDTELCAHHAQRFETMLRAEVPGILSRWDTATREASKNAEIIHYKDETISVLQERIEALTATPQLASRRVSPLEKVVDEAIGLGAPNADELQEALDTHIRLGFLSQYDEAAVIDVLTAFDKSSPDHRPWEAIVAEVRTR